MDNLSEKISGIELKVRQLALKLERLQGENNTLLEENKQLKSDLSAMRDKAGQLEMKFAHQQESNVPSTKNGIDEAHSKKLRKEIDRHMKEIDKCIEWLQNS